MPADNSHPPAPVWPPPQKKVISKCLDLLLEAFAADTESEFDKKIRGAEKTCDEADSYM